MIYNVYKPLKVSFIRGKSLEITGAHKVVSKKGKPPGLLQGSFIFEALKLNVKYFTDLRNTTL